MSAHIATLVHLGNTFYLKGTIWVRERERANEFATLEAAQAALDRAKKFLPLARQKKATAIEPVLTMTPEEKGEALRQMQEVAEHMDHVASLSKREG